MEGNFTEILDQRPHIMPFSLNYFKSLSYGTLGKSTFFLVSGLPRDGQKRRIHELS